MSRSIASKHPMPVAKRWSTILQGCNLPEIEKADPVSRWLVISRACVISMTVTSGLIGLLFALEDGAINWFFAFLSVVGLIAAHLSNNLINDWTDVKMGVDTVDYPRAQYSTHPIFGGLTTSGGLLKGAGILLAVDAVIMVGLGLLRGWPVFAFAFSGLALSMLYTVLLKRFALGELTAMIVWGPMMVGGTAYVSSGAVDLPVLIASLPYGLIVASVLIGKHMDKREADVSAGVRTLPVLLGNRRSAVLLKAASIVFFLLIGFLVVMKITGPYILVSLLSLMRLVKAWKVWGRPRPDAPPDKWTVWPLWYVGWAMYFNRQAGSFLILGLLLNVVVPKLVNLVL
ncbi:MAG: prenyltransferase [Spirochaetales bacterium]|nr:prenyltransferase [Spirochaetales bacterium]